MLFYDVTMLFYDVTMLFYDVTMLFYDVTMLFYDATMLFYDVTMLFYDVTMLFHDVTYIMLYYAMCLQEMKMNLLMFLLAGYETTSTALAYTTYQLALNPHIQTKLQHEIDHYFDTTQKVQNVTP